jgi:hypothetical protein
MKKSNSKFNKKRVIQYQKVKSFLGIEKDKNFDEDDNDIMSHLNYRKLEEIKKDFMKNEE